MNYLKTLIGIALLVAGRTYTLSTPATPESPTAAPAELRTPRPPLRPYLVGLRNLPLELQEQVLDNLPPLELVNLYDTLVHLQKELSEKPAQGTFAGKGTLQAAETVAVRKISKLFGCDHQAVLKGTCSAELNHFIQKTTGSRDDFVRALTYIPLFNLFNTWATPEHGFNRSQWLNHAFQAMDEVDKRPSQLIHIDHRESPYEIGIEIWGNPEDAELKNPVNQLKALYTLTLPDAIQNAFLKRAEYYKNSDIDFNIRANEATSIRRTSNPLETFVKNSAYFKDRKETFFQKIKALNIKHIVYLKGEPGEENLSAPKTVIPQKASVAPQQATTRPTPQAPRETSIPAEKKSSFLRWLGFSSK